MIYLIAAIVVVVAWWWSLNLAARQDDLRECREWRRFIEAGGRMADD